jgi:hypothetical protein
MIPLDRLIRRIGGRRMEHGPTPESDEELDCVFRPMLIAISDAS